MGRTSDARERLVDSGSELMHERGYTAVGVSEICSAAGVKKGSFYHFFPSKVDLALAVIDRHSTAASDALAELVEGTAPPLERLTTYLEGLRQGQVALRQSCGKVLGCPIGNLGLEMSTQQPELRERLRRQNCGGLSKVSAVSSWGKFAQADRGRRIKPIRKTNEGK